MMRRPRPSLVALLVLSGAILAAGEGRAQQVAATEKLAAGAFGPSTMLGRNRCAAATCHGGAIGETVDWNNSLTVFEARDPHAKAGLVLKNDLSRRIVEKLQPEARQAPLVFQRVLEERCSGCHAPAMDSPAAAEESSLIADAYLEGVSCEACHGPAASWLESHVRSDWQVEQGMRATASFTKRVEGCVRCHVGSRQADETVRDMNHDMIAAGHPPLRFDAWAYLRRLPSHWNEQAPRDDGLPVNDPHAQLRRFILGRLIAFQAATELTGQRVRDAGRGEGKSVWPELADFDCFACHQRLRIAQMQAPVSAGFPGYNPWLEAGISEILTDSLADAGADRYQALLDRIRLRSSKSSELAGSCRELSKLLDRPLKIASGADPLPSKLSAWHPFPGEPQTGPSRRTASPKSDWHMAAFWFLRVQAQLADRDEGALTSRQRELSGLHGLLRFRSLLTVPGAVADSPARFEPSHFADQAQQLNEGPSPD